MSRTSGNATLQKWGRDFFKIIGEMSKLHKKIKKIGDGKGNLEDLPKIRKELAAVTRKYGKFLRTQNIPDGRRNKLA